ncbi:MAG: hypothetical protein OER21_16605 [Gemmatimonadota bacterium]|nr:hypothetical protein [Gemmatimonadota bacterium]
MSARPKMVAALAAAALGGCAPSQSETPPRNTLVVGVDVSGSFRRQYDDAIEFAAYYLYGHLHGLGGLKVPTAVFVGSVGGERAGEVKSFHPIHDFQGKSVEQIAASLREWFPPQDQVTDFNTFFDRAATLVKRQNLVLAPLNIVVLSDAVPDMPSAPGDTVGPFQQIRVEPLEFLSRSTTVRLLYPSPTVAVRWERGVERRRVRLWTVDAQVMLGWRGQVALGVPPEGQDQLWQWIADNVDFRVRGRVL